ncbi:MAG: hypothetical protein WC693_02465 [Patescibacteria group bacterium]|jgi:hypothetical protein
MQDTKNRTGKIIIRITAVLGISAGIIYWPDGSLNELELFDVTITSIWASTMFLSSSVLLVFSFLSFRFKKVVNASFLIIMLLLNYSALFFYFVANLEMFMIRSNSGESLLTNIIGFLGHALMIVMISISMFKQRERQIDRTNNRYILRRIFIAIPIILLAGGFVTGGYMIYSYTTNRLEIDKYLEENKPEFPEGNNIIYGQQLGLRAYLPTTRNVANESDLIFQGEVMNISNAYKAEMGLIYHDVTLLPTVFYKNDTDAVIGELLDVSVYGGLVDNQFTYDLNGAKFIVGEKVIVFSSKDGSNYYVTDGAYAKLTIENEGVIGINQEQGLVDMSLDRYIKKLEKVIKDEN